MVVVVVAVVDDILVSKVILLVVIVADLAFQCSWGRCRLEVGFVRHSFGNILPKDRPTKRKTTVFLKHDEVEANAVWFEGPGPAISFNNLHKFDVDVSFLERFHVAVQFILDEFSELLIVGDEEFRGYAIANRLAFGRTKSPPAFCSVRHRLRHHDY